MEIIFMLAFIFLKLSACEDQIIFAFTMFRHGARSPRVTDQFGEAWNRPKELTLTGMRQHYLLGYRNRIRYRQLLSEKYKFNEILVRSSDTNRTIMSALSNLAGLYPTGTGPLLKDNQKDLAVPPCDDVDYTNEQEILGKYSLPHAMQLIPIHIFSGTNQKNDLKKTCNSKRRKEIVEQRKHTPKVLNFTLAFNATYGEKLRLILNNIPIHDYDYFTNYENIRNVCDTFICDITEEKTLKTLRESGIDIMEFHKTAIEILSLDILEVETGDYTLSMVYSSPTVLEILSWMQEKIQGEIKGSHEMLTKFVMYSIHDYDIAAMINYIQSIFERSFNFTRIYPSFASSLYFELISISKDKSIIALTEDDYSVRIFFNDILLLNITYKEFKEKVTSFSFTPDQISAFCQFPINVSYNYYIFFTILFGLIALIECVIIIKRYHMKKSRERQINSSLDLNFLKGEQSSY